MLVTDLDGDGDIDADDLPRNITPGSTEAKAWWKQIESEAREKGEYSGLPLKTGEAGKGQGDFKMLVDKLRITKGYSQESATRIAGTIKHKLYG